MAYRFRERDGPVAAGRSLLLRRAALAAGELAQAGKLCGDRKFRVSFARLRRVASARPAQSREPAVIARAVYRLWDIRDPSFACGTGTNATFPLTPVIAPMGARLMNACPYLAIIIEYHRQRSVLRLHGELDISNRDRLRRAISSALENRPPILVLDLSGLSFTDCAGLSVLVWAHKHLAGRGHELVITGQKPIIQRLMHLTGLDTYLHVSTPEALNDDPDQRARR